MKPKKNDTILDVGFSNIEYSPNDNFLEKNYPYAYNITALGIDYATIFSERYPQVKVDTYDGNLFPYNDKSFSIGWSNAVIEHVGNFDKQLFFLKELNRVSHSFYLTTPNKYFPIEVHTKLPIVHWLPSKIFFLILNLVGKSWATGDYMNLLSKYDLELLLKKADIYNYKIIRNKFMFFTLDFSVIVNSK